MYVLIKIDLTSIFKMLHVLFGEIEFPVSGMFCKMYNVVEMSVAHFHWTLIFILTFMIVWNLPEVFKCWHIAYTFELHCVEA